MFIAAAQVSRNRHALRSRQRRAGVSTYESVARRLFWTGESRKSSELPKRGEVLVAPSEYLPRVRLVAYVPHDPVPHRLEHAHQPYGKFHGP